MSTVGVSEISGVTTIGAGRMVGAVGAVQDVALVGVDRPAEQHRPFRRLRHGLDLHLLHQVAERQFERLVDDQPHRAFG